MWKHSLVGALLCGSTHTEALSCGGTLICEHSREEAHFYVGACI